MNRRNAIVVSSLLALAGLASTSQAQLIADNTYQGVLNSGGSAASGVHQVRFRVYDAAAGGSLLAEQTRQKNFVTADDGRFTFDDLDFGGALATGANRWIEISVRQGTAGAFTVLGPRQPVTSAPTAQYAAFSGTDLDEAYDNGNRITNSGGNPVIIDGNLQLGSSTTAGTLSLYNNTVSATQPIITMQNFSTDGGSIWIRDENGSILGDIEADANDEGLFVQFLGGSGSMLWDGAAGTGASGTLSISGASSSMIFNTNNTGDSSVTLPASSVSAAEILNEAGAANNQSSSVSIPATGALTTLLSRSITCPSSGYVIAFANADLAVSYTGSTVDYMFGVSDSATTLPGNQDMQIRLPAGLASGTYDFPAVAHGLFTVTAGSHTFYFNGGGAFGAAYPAQTFFDPQLTLIFVPTAYGATVSNFPTSDMPNPNDGNWGPGLPGLSPAEIYAEQQAELVRRQAEMNDENARMRAELEAIRRDIEQVRLEQQSRR